MLPQSINDLAEKFRAFPGVGLKSSQKLALDVLQMNPESFQSFIESLQETRNKVKFCSNCGFFAQQINESQVLCDICKSPTRNNYQICLVEKPTEVINIEKTEAFRGKYHVVNNLISPLDNIFAEDTNLPDLIDRRIPESLSNNNNPTPKQQNLGTIELIIFFKSGFTSEATIAYLKEAIKNRGLEEKIKITKLAQGLPLYYNPDTLDQGTLVKALEDRRQVS